MLRLFLSATFLVPAFGAAYSYDQCNTTAGPSAWGGFCQNAGVPQTPVDVCGAVAFPGAVPQFAVYGYDQVRNTTILNNGHTIQVNIGANDVQPWLQLGNISTIVGQTTVDQVYNWSMQQMHLHWGRTNKENEGSEHYLYGKAYPAEMHYVHWNKAKYANISEAVGSGETDALLVVGIFLKIESADSDLIKKIATDVPTLTQEGRPLYDITLSDLFDGTGDYFSYRGSLTTPNCNPVVSWVVMKDPKPITLDSLNKIKLALENPPAKNTASVKFAAQAEPELISLYGNFRPLQKIAGRTIYGSNSAALGSACGTVTQPDFNCNANAGFSSAVFSPIVLLSTFSIMLLSAF